MMYTASEALQTKYNPSNAIPMASGAFQMRYNLYNAFKPVYTASEALQTKYKGILQPQPGAARMNTG